MRNWRFAVRAVGLLLFVIDNICVWSCIPTTPTETVTVPDCSLSNVLVAKNRNANNANKGTLICGGATPNPLIPPDGAGATAAITSPATLASGSSITCICRATNNANAGTTIWVAGPNGVVGSSPTGVPAPTTFSLTCTSGVLSFAAVNPNTFERIGSSVSDVNHVMCSN